MVAIMNEHSIAGYTPAASLIPQSGDHVLHAAERAYRGLLADQPRHFRALCGLAVVRGQLGAPDEARDLLDRAAAAANGHVGDHVVLGAALGRINDLDGARRHFEEAIRRDGQHVEARLQLANVLHRAGQIEAAVSCYEEAIAIDPNSAEAHQSLGSALQVLGRFEAAIPHHRTAHTIEPRLAMAHVGLGDAYRRLSRYDDAILEYERALAINPSLAEVYLNLGGSLQLVGRREDAIRSYQRALAINPAAADVHYNLGVVYADLDNLHAAVLHYERAIELNPTSAEAHNNLANVLCRQRREHDAVKHYREAVRLRPRYADALRNLGDALQTQKSFEQAIACYRAALVIEPDNATLFNRLAAALLVTGEIDEASRAYEAAIARTPNDIGIQLNYANVRPFTDGDLRLVRLEQSAAREAELSEEQRIPLHFALGKAYADLRDGERSFRHLGIANALKRGHVVYDERETLRYMERVGATFSGDLLRARSGRGDPSDAPIFVVGMPRSGTSLVEQILASHPRVFGAGELNDFAIAASASAARGGGAHPEIIAGMSDADLGELGKTYRRRDFRSGLLDGSLRRQDAFEFSVTGADPSGASPGAHRSCAT